MCDTELPGSSVGASQREPARGHHSVHVPDANLATEGVRQALVEACAQVGGDGLLVKLRQLRQIGHLLRLHHRWLWGSRW